MIPTDLPLQKVQSPLLEKMGVELFVYRLDLNHPEISGNKWYKLKYNIASAKSGNKKTVLTYGGAFSNHIAATAAAGKEYGLKTIGIIRGERPAALNPTLEFAESCGMHLHFVSRTLYQDKDALSKYVSEKFSHEEVFEIPEGGSNEAGIKGCMEISESIPGNFDYICCPCGTGATFSGLVLSLKANQKAIGFQILKGEDYIAGEVKNWLQRFESNEKNWEVNEDFHFGGYAKLKPELLNFMLDFQKENSIPLDYIYTGKMMFGIMDLISKGKFPNGSKIVAIHTGGLQGNQGFEN